MNNIQKELIQELNGSEIYQEDRLVLLAYPYIWVSGEKIKISDNEFIKLTEGYFSNPLNEGYWLAKEII